MVPSICPSSSLQIKRLRRPIPSDALARIHFKRDLLTPHPTRLRWRDQRAPPGPYSALKKIVELFHRLGLAALVPLREEISQPEDRKSTRLNSSHVRISYAVFCLKKKKK